MNFTIEKSIEILERTPDVLITMLDGISGDWIYKNEGGSTWKVYEVVYHLILGEKTDWAERTGIILSEKKVSERVFKPFKRFENPNDETMSELLYEFKSLRKKSLSYLHSLDLQDFHLNEKGIHPDFGEVALYQLLAAWVVHDLDHLAQIARIMAYQYSEDVGPWKEYLRIVKR